MSQERVYVYFVFQAEDGIRDGHVTGVQTCALPICANQIRIKGGTCLKHTKIYTSQLHVAVWWIAFLTTFSQMYILFKMKYRSEERRVGKECRDRREGWK